MLTSPTGWDAIIAGSHWFEPRLVVTGGSTYYKDKIIGMTVTAGLFADNNPSAGNAVAAEINIELLYGGETVPRMATVTPYVRVCNNNAQSGWLQQGVFYIDTREVSDSTNGFKKLKLHGYDAMLKAERDYPSTTHEWPANAETVVNDIATAMGVGVDERTTTMLTARSYDIQLPSNYSCREVLGFIAAAYAGNFCIGKDGKLLLLALNSIPPETNYLIDRDGGYLVFGEDRILV